jgi:hypothetical protein
MSRNRWAIGAIFIAESPSLVLSRYADHVCVGKKGEGGKPIAQAGISRERGKIGGMT